MKDYISSLFSVYSHNLDNCIFRSQYKCQNANHADSYVLGDHPEDFVVVPENDRFNENLRKNG
jgi:hypothetical protein